MSIIRRIEDINAWTRRFIKSQIEALDDFCSQPTIHRNTPVNAVAACKSLLFTSVPDDGDLIQVGNIQYAFRNELTTDPDTVPFEVLIGEDVEGCIDNIIAAITASDGDVGTLYSIGTTQSETVTATKESTDTLVVMALVKGDAGNYLHLGFGQPGRNPYLLGGIDGTIAMMGEMCFDDESVYISLFDNTISDTNWKKISLTNLT